MKKCSKCGESKRHNKFYRRYKGSFYSWCKKCHLTMVSKNDKNPVGKTTIASQSLLVEELKRQGIYACNGNGTEYTEADIVAWGCVRIEAKLAKPEGKSSQFTFTFTPKQVMERVVGDVIVLICQVDNDYSFHVLPVNHSSFFKQDGARKGAVSWTPGATPKCRKGYNPTIDDAIMAASKDKWCEIEKIRLSMVDKMRTDDQT